VSLTVAISTLIIPASQRVATTLTLPSWRVNTRAIVACRQNGVLLMVDQTIRDQLRHRKIDELVDAGCVG
jgi:hypothetical protein